MLSTNENSSWLDFLGHHGSAHPSMSAPEVESQESNFDMHVRLTVDDKSLLGDMPKLEEFSTVCCKLCKLPIKMQSIKDHMSQRHPDCSTARLREETERYQFRIMIGSIPDSLVNSVSDYQSRMLSPVQVTSPLTTNDILQTGCDEHAMFSAFPLLDVKEELPGSETEEFDMESKSELKRRLSCASVGFVSPNSDSPLALFGADTALLPSVAAAVVVTAISVLPSSSAMTSVCPALTTAPSASSALSLSGSASTPIPHSTPVSMASPIFTSSSSVLVSSEEPIGAVLSLKAEVPGAFVDILQEFEESDAAAVGSRQLSAEQTAGSLTLQPHRLQSDRRQYLDDIKQLSDDRLALHASTALELSSVAVIGARAALTSEEMMSSPTSEPLNTRDNDSNSVLRKHLTSTELPLHNDAGECDKSPPLVGVRKCRPSGGNLSRQYDARKHCGVWISDRNKHCTRVLDCRQHNLEQKELVARPVPFKDLLAHFKAGKTHMKAISVRYDPMFTLTDARPVTPPGSLVSPSNDVCCMVTYRDITNSPIFRRDRSCCRPVTAQYQPPPVVPRLQQHPQPLAVYGGIIPVEERLDAGCRVWRLRSVVRRWLEPIGRAGDTWRLKRTQRVRASQMRLVGSLPSKKRSRLACSSSSSFPSCLKTENAGSLTFQLEYGGNHIDTILTAATPPSPCVLPQYPTATPPSPCAVSQYRTDTPPPPCTLPLYRTATPSSPCTLSHYRTATPPPPCSLPQYRNSTPPPPCTLPHYRTATPPSPCTLPQYRNPTPPPPCTLPQYRTATQHSAFTIHRTKSSSSTVCLTLPSPLHTNSVVDASKLVSSNTCI